MPIARLIITEAPIKIGRALARVAGLIKRVSSLAPACLDCRLGQARATGISSRSSRPPESPSVAAISFQTSLPSLFAICGLRDHCLAFDFEQELRLRQGMNTHRAARWIFPVGKVSLIDPIHFIEIHGPCEIDPRPRDTIPTSACCPQYCTD